MKVSEFRPDCVKAGRANCSFSITTFVASLVVGAFLTILSVQSTEAARGYSALVFDRNTGKTLYSKNADTPRYPASLTKMMTLYIVFDLIESGRIGYKTTLTVTKHASRQQPSKLGLKAGQKITVYDAIRALVTKSANDVAVTVAENLAGSQAKFARIMTWKARELGMKKTTFKNASGLPNSAQLTTARDMAILGDRLISDFPKHYSFFRTRYFAYKGRSFRNHNSLLFNFTGTDGIKTGYTRASGFNLVASVKRGGKHLIGVVMGGKTSRKRNASMRSILARAFKKASRVKTRVARRADKKVRIPTPMIARARPSQRPVTTRGQHRQTVHRTKFPVPTPQPSLRNTGPTKAPHARRATQTAKSPKGPFHIQVGAYETKREAEASLVEVRRKMGRMLGGHPAVTLPFNLNNRKLYYRARFAGFTGAQASRLCTQVKAARFDCIVMRAE